MTLCALRSLDAAKVEVRRDHRAPEAFIAEAYLLLRTEPHRDAPTANYATGGRADWQLRRIKTFVENNLHNPVRVEELSAIVGLSVSQLSRAPKRRTGQTPPSWSGAAV